MNRLASVLLLFFLPCHWLGAVTVEDLYAVSVPVASQSDEDRILATKEGFKRVLTRVAGEAEGGLNGGQSWRDNSALLNSWAKALSQYGYENSPTEFIGEGQVLNMSFNPGVVEALLGQYGYKIWASDRPATLIWLEVDVGPNGDGKYVLADGEPRELAEQLKKRANSRGVPLLLPLLDLEDQAHLNQPFFWQGQQQFVQQASLRYQVKVIALGQLVDQEPQGWRARWKLFVEDQQTLSWESEADSLESLLGLALDDIAETLSRKLAVGVTREVESSTLMVVEGIDSHAAYRRTMDYLKTIQGIAGVLPSRVQDDQVIFSLSLSGTLAEVTRSISFGELLEALDTPLGAADASTIDLLRYRLVDAE